MNTSKNIDEYFSILNLIDNNPEKSQRDMAQDLSLSLGKVNFLLKELTKKGLIKIDRFLNSNNKWAYRYLLTSYGIKEKFQITKKFLKRKENEYFILQKEIERLRQIVEKNEL
jgi:EPS-associated MarR family transcriptional regulator